MNSTTYVKVLSKGPEAYLPDIENGKLRFTTDTGRLFLDSEDQRIEISDFVKDKTSEQILNTDSPLPKFYLASDNDRLYFYANNQWKTVKVDIGLATTASSGLIPALNGSTVNFLRGDGTWAEAGNAKYEELEREDYEALTDDEKKNSTLYLVKDKREDPDLPALIGEYYKIDNSRLNPNVSTDYIRWYFNRSDAEYIYEKYGIYDWNFHPPYDGPGWGNNSNFLITDNMPVDTCYIMTLFTIYGLSGRMLVFIPKEIIDNGIGCMTRNGFYSTQDFEYYTIEFWGDWSDPASYGTIETHTFECAGGIQHIHPGQHFETTRMSFCNIPYLVGYDFSVIKPGRDLQESLDRYLADRSYSEFPEFYDGNYFLYNGIMREYDGTLMVNDIDYTDRIDISKYALKASLDAYATTESLSGYATTAALAGKQDTLTAGTGISINGTTISSTGGGSSVSITPTLATGTKIADYSINGSTGELYAPNGGGGGSSVTPNPAGPATENLDTIGIDGVIYNIPGSGGGSGSGTSGYATTLLYDSGSNTSGAATNTDINLLDNLSNYDMGLIIVSTPTDRSETQYQSSGQIIFDTKYVLINDNYHKLHWAGYGNRWLQIKFTDTTFNVDGCGGEDSGHTPVIYKIYGIKFGNGSSGKSAEVIPIEAGDNTTSRTFTFENTPKFIKVYYQDTTLDGGWTLDSEMAWGQEYINYKAHNMTVSVTGLTGGLSSISYGSDGKSMTITSGNAFGSYNTANGSGFMFVDYGTGGSEGNTKTDVLWSGSETPTAGNPYRATLSESYENYDLLIVEAYENNDGVNMPFTIPTTSLKVGEPFGIDYYQSGVYISIVDTTHIDCLLFAGVDPTTYTAIKGVKFGVSSGGKGYSETDLFVNPNAANPASISLNDSIQNYDEIVLAVTRNAYGNTYKLQYRYTVSVLALNDQIQVWCWGPNNEYISYVLTDWDTFGNMAQGNALLLDKIIGIKYSSGGNTGDIYDTEERVVGTWFGDTLYQKSYTNFSSLTGANRTLDFQLSGIDKIWYVPEACLISNGVYPFPYVHSDTNSNAIGGFWDLSVTGSPKFEFRTGSQSTGAVIDVFTIRYTKSTS